MSELDLFWRSVSLWIRLLMRMAAMTVILFGALLLTRTVFDPGNCLRNDGQSVELPHVGYIVIHAPVVWLFWWSANSIFVGKKRRTAWQELSSDFQPVLSGATLILPVIASAIYCIYGLPEYRVGIATWITVVAAVPVCAWCVFKPDVFEVFADSDAKAREAERKRRRNERPNYALLMRIMRRDYEDKIRDISRMRIEEEHGLYLQELAGNEYRDAVERIIGGGTATASGGDTASIEAILHDNEEQ